MIPALLPSPPSLPYLMTMGDIKVIGMVSSFTEENSSDLWWKKWGKGNAYPQEQ